MKKRLIKFVTGLMSIGLLLSACSNNGGGGETTTSTSNGNEETETTEVASNLPEPGDYEEAVDLTLSGAFTKGDAVDGSWVQERLEEMYNANITNVKTDTWDPQQTSILVASNELPDVFSFTSTTLTPYDFFNDGLTRAIPREMIEKYAPHYTEMLNSVDNGLGWQLNQNPDNPDEYISLLGYQGHTEGIIWAPTLRMDWMENLGIEIPEDATPIGDSDGYERIYLTEHSYTIDELEEILTKFVEEDPDGNGQDDTYGILPANDNLGWAGTLLGAYGVAEDYNLLEDGELKQAPISNAYKEWLKKMAEWYEKGLIDPEWTTLDTKTTWDKYLEGKTGYFIAQRTYLAQEAWTEGRAPQNLINNNPDVKLLAYNHETGPDGESGQKSYMPVTLLGDNMYVAADVTDEQLARFLQMFDFMNFDEEAYWTKYGIPGEHSDWMGEEWNSTLITRPEYDREEGEMGFWAYNHRSYYGEHLTWLNHVKTQELMDKFFNVPEVVDEHNIRPYKFDLFNETNQQELESRYQAQLDTIVDEFVVNAITGNIDIDAEWDAYVENYLNNGGSEILSELEKAPVVEELLSGE